MYNYSFQDSYTIEFFFPIDIKKRCIHLLERKNKKEFAWVKVLCANTSTIDSFILGGNHLKSSCTREVV